MSETAALRRRRLAFFSPVPPIASGIATYLTDLLPLLPADWQIDVFTDDGVDTDPGFLAGRGGCYSHEEFASRDGADPYDLNVYQVGNSSERAYLLDYVTEHPGLLVLHDGVLHPARVAAATAAAEVGRYRDMVRACRPDVGDAVGHLVAAGLGGPAMYLTFPMCEDLVRRSLVTGVHGDMLAGWLRGLVPEADIVALTHWRSVSDQPQSVALRAELAGDDEVLIGSFGNIGAERRLEKALRALAGIESPWRLVVAGQVDDALGLPQLAEDLNVAARISWRPGLDDDAFNAHLAVVDMAINLRYPPVRASSGVLHQLLQLGVPTLISDVVHWRDYPEDTVARIPPGPDEAEDEALAAVFSRWLADPVRRRQVGDAARKWAAATLTPQRMAVGYVEAIEQALAKSV